MGSGAGTPHLSRSLAELVTCKTNPSVKIHIRMEINDNPLVMFRQRYEVIEAAAIHEQHSPDNCLSFNRTVFVDTSPWT